LKLIWETSALCEGSQAQADTWAAPSIKGGKLVVPGRKVGADLVFCFNADTGALIWKSEYPTTDPPQRGEYGKYGRGAKAAPAIDKGRVYTFGNFGHLACWNLEDGTNIWMRKVEADGGRLIRFGHAGSPLIVDNLVVVLAGGEWKAFAYDKETGKLVWKGLRVEPTAPRDEGEALPVDDYYASPAAAVIDGTIQIVALTGEGVFGLDAKTGKEIWRFPWEKLPTNMTGSTPLVHGSRVVVGSCYQNPNVTGVNVQGSKAAAAWKKSGRMALHHADPILLDGCMYFFSGHSTRKKGEIRCLDFATGEERWSSGQSDEFGTGTMVYADGCLLCLDNRGKLFLVEARPLAFKKIGEMQVFQVPESYLRLSWTGPVVAGGKVYLRLVNRLVCYDLLAPR
jgi:outer membrane protein assembly factor BamB